MSTKKRSASEIETDATSGTLNKKGPNGKRAGLEKEDDMGDFEDEWDDEVEGDEENTQGGPKSDDENGMHYFKL